MAKKSGKTATKPAEQAAPAKEGQHYDYTSFNLWDRKGKDENGKDKYTSPLSPAKVHEDGTKDWKLNVKVPESVSPTGYMNVMLPTGKLSTDPNGRKNLFFKNPCKDKDGNEIAHKFTYYIANEVNELKCVATGAAGKPGVGTEISISPMDLRKAVIEQSKADAAAYAKSREREVPEVEAEAAEAQVEGLSK